MYIKEEKRKRKQKVQEYKLKNRKEIKIGKK